VYALAPFLTIYATPFDRDLFPFVSG